MIQGAVSQIWIAFGADVDALELGLRRLRAVLSERSTEGEAGESAAPVQLLGSVFVPSKMWIDKMRFRCWAGTYLGGKDDEGSYLSSVEAAAAITRRVRSHGSAHPKDAGVCTCLDGLMRHSLTGCMPQVLALFVEYGVETVIESAVRSAAQVVEVVEMLDQASMLPGRVATVAAEAGATS